MLRAPQACNSTGAHHIDRHRTPCVAVCALALGGGPGCLWLLEPGLRRYDGHPRPLLGPWPGLQNSRVVLGHGGASSRWAPLVGLGKQVLWCRHDEQRCSLQGKGADAPKCRGMPGHCRRLRSLGLLDSWGGHSLSGSRRLPTSCRQDRSRRSALSLRPSRQCRLRHFVGWPHLRTFFGAWSGVLDTIGPRLGPGVTNCTSLAGRHSQVGRAATRQKLAVAIQPRLQGHLMHRQGRPLERVVAGWYRGKGNPLLWPLHAGVS